MKKPYKIHAFAWIFHFNAVSIISVSTFQQCRNHYLKKVYCSSFALSGAKVSERI